MDDESFRDAARRTGGAQFCENYDCRHVLGFDERRKCAATQYGDCTVCEPCGLEWDTGDDPPRCGRLPDDGLGERTYCERGNSRCLDQCCACVNNSFYRVAYLRARGEINPVRLALAMWPLLLAAGAIGVAVWLLAGG